MTVTIMQLLPVLQKAVNAFSVFVEDLEQEQYKKEFLDEKTAAGLLLSQASALAIALGKTREFHYNFHRDSNAMKTRINNLEFKIKDLELQDADSKAKSKGVQQRNQTLEDTLNNMRQQNQGFATTLTDVRKKKSSSGGRVGKGYKRQTPACARLPRQRQ
jgi:hypothetical protein